MKKIISSVICLLLASFFYAQSGNDIKKKDGLKGQLYVLDEVDEYKLIIKFRSNTEPIVENGEVHFLNHSLSLKTTKSLSDLTFTPLINLTAEEKQRAKKSSQRTQADEKGFNILDFAGLCEVNTKNKDKHYLLKLGKDLEKLNEVEYCSLEPVKTPPPPGFFAYATPDLTNRQGYRKPNPGIDVDYAWSQGAMGQGVKISDIEYSWGKLDHEEFVNQDISYGTSHNANSFEDHGIAVMGILVGDEDNNLGIKGTAPKAVGRVYSEIQGRATAIIKATQNSQAGDVIVLEMQTGGPDGKLAPADVTQSVWDAVKAATDAGVIVVAAAGNGSANLDSSSYSAYRNRGDNGSIIVGAGTSNSAHNKLGFSTYGQRVNVQGWGHNVFTTGYGDVTFDNDYKKEYTATFGGTSSATPIVTSAVACIQSYAKEKLGKLITPREMRDLLMSTGVAQGSGGHIGPLPNIKEAIKKLGNVGGCSDGDSVSVTFSNTTDCALEYYQNNTLRGTANAGGNFNANTTVGSIWEAKKKSTGDIIDNFSIVCNQTTYSSSGNCNSGGNPCDGVAQWSNSVQYQPGDKVVFQGGLWIKTASSWDYLGSCSANKSIMLDSDSDLNLKKKDVYFKVYPNPVTEVLNIEINMMNVNSNRIELKDISGRVLKTQLLKTSPDGMFKGQFDVSDLLTGTYFLQIKTTKEMITQKVFIK
ncbi:S8 family serine peptidase [Aquimarina aquimarini]|uniref:S8 family serine peptidase n=1 Tax=Aquimarina aquimarini TaxID=1191734 RepID=UPI000D558E1A|nr:S8 family serine peptidase [Aquimarina aquimarini]